MLDVAVVGTGYVGLVTAVGLAVRGHRVTCVDQRREVVDTIAAGRSPIYEPGLDAMLVSARTEGRLVPTTDLASAVREADVTMIAVGTPTVDGQIDLSQVREVTKQIGEALAGSTGQKTVVVKSTVLPGTTDTLVRPLLVSALGKTPGRVGVGMNPEFLREGAAVSDFMEPDRIVIGADDDTTARHMHRLYEPWTATKMTVNTRTAEFIKYANNALLALQISATNELADLAASLGSVDIEEVMAGVSLDHRWNPLGKDGNRVEPGILTYLRAGCGFGGSCFPKDVAALVALGRESGIPLRIFEDVLAVNAERPAAVMRLLESGLGSVRGRRVAVLGLAFKPGTDDIRESPGLKIVRAILDAGGIPAGADPVAHVGAATALAGKASIHSDWRLAAKDAEAVVFATAWPEYRDINPLELGDLMSGDLLVDGRRMLTAPGFDASFRVFRLGAGRP